jgi:hypothetical protein
MEDATINCVFALFNNYIVGFIRVEEEISELLLKYFWKKYHPLLRSKLFGANNRAPL